MSSFIEAELFTDLQSLKGKIEQLHIQLTGPKKPSEVKRQGPFPPSTQQKKLAVDAVYNKAINLVRELLKVYSEGKSKEEVAKKYQHDWNQIIESMATLPVEDQYKLSDKLKANNDVQQLIDKIIVPSLVEQIKEILVENMKRAAPLTEDDQDEIADELYSILSTFKNTNVISKIYETLNETDEFKNFITKFGNEAWKVIWIKFGIHLAFED